MLRAVAAALRRRLQESSQGEVPIVKFEESETRVWKVWSVGREIRADWWVTQKCLTESKELANRIRYLVCQICWAGERERQTYAVPKSRLEDGTVFPRPFLCYARVDFAEFMEGAEEWPSGDLGDAFYLGLVCCVCPCPEGVDDGEDGEAEDRGRHD